MSRKSFVHTFVLGFAMLLLAGCATTPKINWDARIGNYSYDQAVLDYGPPDKMAKLSDGSTVVEWLTSRGSRGFYSPWHGPFYSHGYGYYPYGLGSMGYYDPPTPDRYLRLAFDADGMLKAWRRIAK